jgi:hypothetical protein
VLRAPPIPGRLRKLLQAVAHPHEAFYNRERRHSTLGYLS